MSLNNPPRRHTAQRQGPGKRRLERISAPPRDIAGAADFPDRDPSLSTLAAQLRAAAPDLEMLQRSNLMVTALANQLQTLERRIRSLESTRLDLIRQERVQQRSHTKSIFNRNR
jgi:small-conductance mechanosensitive channel